MSSCPGLALLGARTRARPFWTFNKPNVERFIEKQGTWPARRGRDHLAALKRGEVDIAYSLEGEINEEPQRTPNLKFKAPIVGSAFPTSGMRGRPGIMSLLLNQSLPAIFKAATRIRGRI